MPHPGTGSRAGGCVPAVVPRGHLPLVRDVDQHPGQALQRANKPHATDSILSRLDPLSGELRGRIFFPHHHAAALHLLGEHVRERIVVRAGRAQYPGRLYLAIDEIRVLIALGQLGEALRAIDAMFTLAPELRGSTLSFGVIAMYELRWHGHAANIVALRLRGVAFAMQGKRALALGVDSTLASATTSERLVDHCYLGTIPGSCRRVARAYIAAALGDKARAVSLLDVRTFNDISAHYDLMGE